MAHKRRSFFLIPLFVTVCAVIGGLYGPNTQVASAAGSDDEISASVKQFTGLYSTVEQNFADPLSADKAIYGTGTGGDGGAIPGMLRTLDPHSNFFDPTALKAMREEQSGHYAGVGMRVEGKPNQTGVMQTIVVEPFVGSPAYKAGLRPNDVIINVNGKDTNGLSSTDVAELLKGQKGTPVKIQVLRGEGAEQLVFNLVRDEINRSSVPTAFMLKPGIGYIQVDEFIETTGADFDAAMKKLDEDNLKGLVLDLRGNPGGLLTDAVHVAGHLLPKGDEIVSHHGRASEEKVYKATEGNHGHNFPIVVLVNRNSASASEIVSGALQDHDRAWILGDNTFGKGLVQTVYPLTENTGLALTTAKYYTPSGRLIQRDYSSVSFFDYYYRNNTAARNPADVKMTDSGRTVYGGGGISPDEKFTAPKPGPLETDLYVKYMFQGYTRHFFSTHKEQLPQNWTFDAAQMTDFHNWLQTQKFDFTDAEFTKEYEPIRRRMQGEFYKSAFNVDDSTRYIVQTDPEVQAAIEAMPKAQALLDSANKIRAEKGAKVVSPAQIAVLDTGGQYCHLIARKVRELGVSSAVFPSESGIDLLRHARGIIISGGPSSVYDQSSPSMDAAVLAAGIPTLGICYGQQLITQLLGGEVRKGDKGEFGLAFLDLQARDSRLLEGLTDHQKIWMSHRDLVAVPPPGFRILATTSTCPTAAIEDAARNIYGVQFHPEVVHTTEGGRILKNFLFGICGCAKDWNPSNRIAQVEEQIRERAGERSIFFFVSGGVDSTVAFSLCLEALGSERVCGVYVDTGLMREGETEFVEETFAALGHGVVSIEHAEEEFLGPLEGVHEPELKRHIIGEQFVKVQERVMAQRGVADGSWILGQGTIYPDTIESGGNSSDQSKAATIKTHHNRVPGIQRLMEQGLIVEPLADFYKDEVREIGREMGLSAALLERHPFPGPGLAIRCLCSAEAHAVTRVPEGWLVPVHSVGVQGDSRSYAPVLAIDTFPSAAARLQDEATELVNRTAGVNRVIACVAAREPLGSQRVFVSSITHGRLALLRRADGIVRELSLESGFDAKVWQFPVILIPLGSGESRDSVVLRPIYSVDGMTADSVTMPDDLLRTMSARLLEIPEIAGVYYDLTHKPPGTIEWE